MNMKMCAGKSACTGIAIGRIFLWKKQESQVKRETVTDVSVEVERFERAKEQAKGQLQDLYNKALREVGESGAMIFEVHQMILDDEGYGEGVINMIQTQKVNAEFAVAANGDNLSEAFAAMEDEYMRERAADLRDITDRVLKVLQGRDEDLLNSGEPVILVAEDLAPSETVQLDKSKILSFVTRYGSTNSHTAILARTMGIPALTGVKYPEEINGKIAIVDGFSGTLYLEPDEELLGKYEVKKKEEKRKKKLLLELKGKEDITKDGRKIHLFANIGGVHDVASVLANDACGIGLFRTEFLYLESHQYPGEEEQFQAYKTVVETMAGKKVVIRTLDIGADKQADYFQLDKEENPAMGYRAIRFCLDRQDVFKTQLRAIFRASHYGLVSIMFPMVISVQEVRQAKKLVEEVKTELGEQGIPFGNVEIGIMIETPAAALISDQLAKEVDFFSVGTNDLTQYTLAIDRQNPKLDYIYDTSHEAIMRLLQFIVKSGHKEGCWVGMCGELGADMELTETFLRMEFDELSVSPSNVLPLRAKIRSITLD